MLCGERPWLACAGRLSQIGRILRHVLVCSAASSRTALMVCPDVYGHTRPRRLRPAIWRTACLQLDQHVERRALRGDGAHPLPSRLKSGETQSNRGGERGPRHRGALLASAGPGGARTAPARRRQQLLRLIFGASFTRAIYTKGLKVVNSRFRSAAVFRPRQIDELPNDVLVVLEAGSRRETALH